MPCPLCFCDTEQAKRTITGPNYWAANVTSATEALFRHGIECGDNDALLFLLNVGFAHRRARIMEQVIDGPAIMRVGQN